MMLFINNLSYNSKNEILMPFDKKYIFCLTEYVDKDNQQDEHPLRDCYLNSQNLSMMVHIRVK